MIKAKTDNEKRALAEALMEHDPGFLEDLKLMKQYFGLVESLEYFSLCGETNELVRESFDRAMARYRKDQEELARASISAARKSLGEAHGRS